MPSSTSPSRSATPENAETMQIFVKPISGDSKHPHPLSRAQQQHQLTLLLAFPITVPQDLTIHNLTTLLSVRTSLPESELRLVFAGKHLSSSSTLADYGIQRESTLHLASPLRGGMPPKKIRCSYKECREGAQRIIGDCGFCNGHYCGKHRLLEDHKCDGLEDVSSPLSAEEGEGEPQWWLIGLNLGLCNEGYLADIMCDPVQEGVSRPKRCTT